MIPMWRLALAVSLLLCACSRRPDLPALPELRIETFQPSVRSEVEEAWASVKASPLDTAANGRLGMVLHAHEQFGAAKVMYQRARALDPKQFAWPYYLAHVEGSLGNRAAALEALDAAARIDAAYGPLRLRRAEILLDQGNLEESGRQFADLLREQPASAAAWYGQGRVRLALGDAAGAVDPLRKATELCPQYGAAHHALAQALRSLGRQEEAHRHTELSQRYRTTGPALDDRWIAEVSQLNRGAAELLRMAKTAEEQGRLAEAEELSRRALAADPKSVEAHVNLISLCGRGGKFVEAAEHYQQAVALNPNHAEAHYNYGVMQFEQKNLREARRAFEKALEANRYFADAHNNLGYLLEMEGQAAEALKHYRAAVENQPGHRLAHFHLGRLLANQRRYPEAIRHLEQTLSPEDASTPGYLYALGAVYGRSGDRVRSVDLMTQARDKAVALGQSTLVASIEKDLMTLGAR